MVRRLILVALLAVAPAVAADRHVFLDTDADGQLNDCPNPAHNADGSADDTSELEECVGGTHEGKVIGTATGRVTSGTCTGAGGSVAALNTGDTADVDGDGTIESVYGHPQACVWNMSGAANGGPDSCEVHAGEYRNPGARAGTRLVDATDDCDRSECWNASVVALGNGPNMGTVPGSGYGTAGNPGYLRGAVMGGSTDTWDSDGDKIPDVDESVTSYPAILSGDIDNDGVWDGTACTSATDCTGDTFYAVFYGCGHDNVDGNVCPSSLDAGQDSLYIDDDANGTFEAGDELGPTANWNSSYLTVKDLEFKRYNGGPTTCTAEGIRDYIGHFTWSGGNNSVDGKGYDVEHIYWHSSAYSTMCRDEAFVAIFGDNENHYSTVPNIVSDSFFISGNRFILNDDCGEYGECGGNKIFHDNRIIFPPTRLDGEPWATTGPGPSSSGEYQSLMRIKSHDTVMTGTAPKVMRWYNNEFIWQRAPGTPSGSFLAIECFGICYNVPNNDDCTADETPYPCCGGLDIGSSNSLCTAADTPYNCCTGSGTGTCTGPCEMFYGPGQGEIWYYGNLFRFQDGGADNGDCTAADDPYDCCTGAGTGTCPDPKWNSRHAMSFCSVFDCTDCDVNGPNATTEQKWKWYAFNNTWDVEKLNAATSTFDYVCNGTGTEYLSKNNVWRGVTAGTVHTETATTKTTENAVCSSGSSSGCTHNSGARNTWWTVGTLNAAVLSGMANYIPLGSGPLDEVATNNACDPDDDGVAGVDYDGDGDNDLTWNDIAGNLVYCPTAGTALDIGAIQSSADSPPEGGGGSRRAIVVNSK